MDIGLIGLGRMGLNMARRLVRDRHTVVGYDRNPDQGAELVSAGGQSVKQLEGLPPALPSPRALWMMVPAGSPVDDVIGTLQPLLSNGDVLIDGGNSNYKDTQRRAEALAERGIALIDVGTSGGIWGLELGYCMMVGGERDAFERIEPALQSLAPPDGYLHVGPSGAGHFVKMIHNGIEYGMLQAYAEGFELLYAADFDLDLQPIAHLWNQGSVIRSWLLELAERAFQEDPTLAGVRGYVEDSGEGRWTVQEAIERSVPAPVIAHALFARFASRQQDGFAAKLIAALRQQFGGHAVKTKA